MDTPVASTSNGYGTSPLAFIVAAWLGMPTDEILRGLAEGWIAAPPGSPPGWTPPWLDGATATSSDSGWGPANDPAAGDASEGDPQNLISDDGPSTAPSRSTVEGWLRAIDPALANDALETLWQSGGGEDAARGAWWRDYLQRALGVAVDTSAGDMEALDAAIGAASADPANRATIVSLAGQSGEALAELAKSDAGIRYALAQMDPVALTGNRALAASRDPRGEFDRFDPDTGERLLTDAFIADRSKLVAWKLRQEGGGDLAIAGDARWTFVDRARVGDDGAPFTLTLEGEQADPSTVAHQVVFGTSSADVITGGAVDDRLYGESGDDFVRGGAGSDHIEGGGGADTLVGGRGDDQLVGGAGDDDVDGGAGGDAIEGGTGDDALTGGRGDDTLEGGAGDDTYFFESGDGHDVIVDADGHGHVVLDDADVTGAGATREADGVWRSADGVVEYRYTRTADDPGVLSIRAAGDDSVNGDEIRIRGWQNGALGITLDDWSAPAADPSDVAGPMAIDRTVLPIPTRPADRSVNVESDPADAMPTELSTDVASLLVAPDVVDTALRSFAGVSEPPDITAALHPWDGANIGLTAQHLSSAMLDFHDSGDLAIDQAASEPQPVLIGTTPTTQGVSIAGVPGPTRSLAELVAGRGIGQRQ